MSARTVSILLFLLSLGITGGFPQTAPFAPETIARSLDSLQKDLSAAGCERNSCEDSTDEKVRALVARAREQRTTLHLSPESLKGCKNAGISHLRLDGIHEAGWVQTQCGWNLNLIFSVKEDGGWRYLQTILVPNRNHEARVTAASVTGDESQQVIVHRAQYQSRTGASHTSFVVYKLREGKLQPILDVVEAGRVADPWAGQEVSQNSEFTFRQNKNTGPYFEETQIVRFSDLRIELKREHTWSKDDQMFVATPWYSGQRLAPKGKRRTP